MVAPDADTNALTLDVGAVREPPRRAHRDAPLQVTTNGDLEVKTDGGEIRFHKPVVYQPASTKAFPAIGWTLRQPDQSLPAVLRLRPRGCFPGR